MYADIFGTLAIAGALVQKGVGVGVGTALAFMMSVTALSLPSMIMLRRVVKLPLLGIYVVPWLAIPPVGVKQLKRLATPSLA